MRVLVLGGTGAIGIHLIQLLSEKHIETYVTSRVKRNSDKNINYIEGNALNSEFIDTLLKEHWDVIIDFMVYTTASFKETINKYLISTEQYIFLSSARVYSNSSKPINENSTRLLDDSTDKEFLETDEYSLTKARQEDILSGTGKRNWTIIRPYITYNETRLQLGVLEKEEWLYRALHGRTIVFSEDINSKITTLTYGLDVSKGIMATIGNKTAYGEIYNITCSEKMSWENILKLYLDTLKKHLGYYPKVKLLNNNEFLVCKPAKYQINYDRLYNRVFDTQKISDFLNPNDFTRIEIGLCNCLESFLKEPQFNNINWYNEAKKDRMVKEFTSLNEISGFKQKLKYLLYRFNIMK